jgi:hypothetical protein
MCIRPHHADCTSINILVWASGRLVTTPFPLFAGLAAPPAGICTTFPPASPTNPGAVVGTCWPEGVAAGRLWSGVIGVAGTIEQACDTVKRARNRRSCYEVNVSSERWPDGVLKYAAVPTAAP